jgi:signal transduction histidine kinase
VYKNTGASIKALDFLERSMTLNDSIRKETTQKQLSEFQIKYETAEKELELERRQNLLNRHNTERKYLLAGLTVTIIILVLLWFLLRLRRKRNRELIEMNATKDKFFSIISHDLNNPAIAQRDAVQLLIENSAQWNADVLQNYYGKLLKSAEGQVELLFNLLNWAQVQTNRISYHPILFDLIADLQNDISIAQNIAANKGVTLVVDTRRATSQLVTGDSKMICIVVRNLLTNAIKFTPAGGTVTLEIIENGKWRMENGTANSILNSETKYIVSVTDTGVGMTSEQINNLFRLDGRHSRSGTAGETGSGLGLIVCKELIEKHSSTLYIESEVGKGSRFWFEL